MLTSTSRAFQGCARSLPASASDIYQQYLRKCFSLRSFRLGVTECGVVSLGPNAMALFADTCAALDRLLSFLLSNHLTVILFSPLPVFLYFSVYSQHDDLHHFRRRPPRDQGPGRHCHGYIYHSILHLSLTRSRRIIRHRPRNRETSLREGRSGLRKRPQRHSFS